VALSIPTVRFKKKWRRDRDRPRRRRALREARDRAIETTIPLMRLFWTGERSLNNARFHELLEPHVLLSVSGTSIQRTLKSLIPRNAHRLQPKCM
jgi:hypothetical protein